MLLLSITEWCQVGTLITSCAIILFAQWLTWEALAAGYRPSDGSVVSLGPPAWLDLTVGSAGLLALLAFGGSWRGDAAPSPVAVELASQAQRASDSQSASARDEESSDTTVPHTEANIDTWDFAMQCLVHSVAAA
mmetsp:Transcript_96062/g.258225  ORF Transcript_96062/g.258225 Transcript_96062/m.258225 type:complete len:135 (+) Transcript_96062:274-678(+)